MLTPSDQSLPKQLGDNLRSRLKDVTKPKLRFAILVSRFNPKVTGGLKDGAIQTLRQLGIDFDEATDLFEAPGAFELPVMAQALAKTGRFAGVICLGCVIKGDTAHFEFISLGTSVGLMQAMLNLTLPISFGVLTTYSQEQAVVRSSNNEHNKGREAALACLEAALFVQEVSSD